MKGRARQSKDGSWQRRSPELRQSKYSDGHPLRELQYLETKIILKGDRRFTSAESFSQFAKVVRRAAENAEVDFSRKGFKEERPKISGEYKVKFKAEALPLTEQVGGLRLLYSQNVEFPLSAVREADHTSRPTLLRVLPALKTLQTSETDRLELVNATAVEEVLQDIGMLDFGKGMVAKCDTSAWRRRGDQKQLVGEFAFQVKARRRDEIHAVVVKRAEQFFIALQHAAQDWLALGTTKTGAVYRLKGNPPSAHE